PAASPFLVTLNQTGEVNDTRILFHTTYRHPQYTPDGFPAQGRWEDVSARNRTHYCAAYWGYGFHEDGVRSGVRAAQSLGVPFWTAPDISAGCGAGGSPRSRTSSSTGSL